MRLLLKIIRKLAFFALMIAASAYAAKYGWRLTMQATGQQVSAEESDLMATVFDSAVKLVSGQAKKDELASQLSDKLYAGRANPREMKDLGIEIVKPGGSPVGSEAGAALSSTAATSQNGAHSTAGSPSTQATATTAGLKQSAPLSVWAFQQKMPLLLEVWRRLGGDRLGLALIPVAIGSMVLKRRFRRKASKLDDTLSAVLAMQNSHDTDVREMAHDVQALGSEEFELLVALIYQRQGYRVTMPEGLSGGKGGDFTVARKAERALVQCRKSPCDHRIAVERVKEFHEAMVAANFTKGFYVASCGFSWDARHFAKTKGITLINAKTLDQQIDAAQGSPKENLIAVDGWAAALMQKVTLTPALCPMCDAAMDDMMVNGRSVWLCSQRPDCRGARNARKRRKPAPGSLPVTATAKKVVVANATLKPLAAKPAAAAEPQPIAGRPLRVLLSSKVTVISEEEAAQMLPDQDELVASESTAINNDAATALEAEETYSPPTGVRSVVPRTSKDRPAPIANGVDNFLSHLTVRFSVTRLLARRARRAVEKAQLPSGA